MKITYRLCRFGRVYMLAEHQRYGDNASTAALAKMVPREVLFGLKPEQRLGIQEVTWGNAPVGGTLCVYSTTLVDVEEYPGQWAIGVPGNKGYRPARLSVAPPELQAARASFLGRLVPMMECRERRMDDLIESILDRLADSLDELEDAKPEIRASRNISRRYIQGSRR